MATSMRSTRSNVTPAGRPDESRKTPARPALRVITGDRDRASGGTHGFKRLLAWTSTRKAPMLNVVISVVFLAACLIASLALRTQMAQNSFAQSQVQQNISTLTQDVEDDQAKLDALQASLPDKAQKMGMVPQQGSISIDLNGYHAANGGTTK